MAFCGFALSLATFDLTRALSLLSADVDKLTPEHRSWNMARIRGRNTSPERAVRSLLHRLGFRFRLHRKDLPGRPDIVLAKRRKVILVHGCFWHRHSGCKYAYMPKTRTEFWEKKFEKNIARDRDVIASLVEAGWGVLVVWECELRDVPSLTRKLSFFINERDEEL